MNSHELRVEKTAKYVTHGDPSTAKRVWICLHGYGQLAQYFIRNFEDLDPKDNFVICPEGFHRFYLKGVSGRVGASWMTKEERLTDIDDYVRYLDHLYQVVVEPIRNSDTQVILFGFSQGVATGSRWIALGSSSFNRAIFWAGSFPPDLPPLKAKQKFQDLPLTCVIGDQDEYIDEEGLKKIKAHLSALDIAPNWVEYAGGHLIPRQEFNKIANTL